MLNKKQFMRLISLVKLVLALLLGVVATAATDAAAAGTAIDERSAIITTYSTLPVTLKQ